MTYIEQEVFDKVKEFVGDNHSIIIPLTRYAMELASKSGMKVDPINPDTWDVGWTIGFIMGILVVELQQNGEIEAVEPIRDDQWGF